MDFLNQKVGRIGMGCWAIGGELYAGTDPHGFPGSDDKVSKRTIHAALDAGVSVFDTASVYGAGHSERVLSAALKGRSDAMIVSKLGHAFDEVERQLTGNAISRDEVLAAIDGSLLRLGRETIDVMLLHLNQLPVAEALPVFDAMEDAKKSGKIRSYGWSTDIPDSVTAMATRDGFVAVEHAMNLFVDVPTIKDVIAKNNLIALNRSPLAMGLLTGKFSPDVVIPPSDARFLRTEKRDYFQDAKPNPAHLENIEAVRALLQTGGRTLAQGALCWLLAKSNQNLPIPGARTPEQVFENASAMEFGPLADDVMDEIELLMRREPEGEARWR